jgi:hypothetical protein
MMEAKHVTIGSHVIYIDSLRREHDALVTAVWGPSDATQAINLLFVSEDEAKHDPYGRQIERQTSCCHLSMNSAGANCWKFPS